MARETIAKLKAQLAKVSKHADEWKENAEVWKREYDEQHSQQPQRDRVLKSESYLVGIITLPIIAAGCFMLYIAYCGVWELIHDASKHPSAYPYVMAVPQGSTCTAEQDGGMTCKKTEDNHSTTTAP